MHQTIAAWFADYGEQVRQFAHRLWQQPETAWQEQYACQQTAEFLRQQGFTVETFAIGDNPVADNTVRAVYGSGHPIIGILGEYDALDGLGQEAVPYQKPIAGPGHGCGHNLMAAFGIAAAASLKAAMEAEQLSGTLVYMATPAEETLHGKVLLASMGYFDDWDLAFAWHPVGCPASFDPVVFNATTNIVFEFFGRSAHAGTPWEGRSALDAAELMTTGIQYLREHMTPDCRVHYTFLDGGVAPNIVPDHASVYCFIRSLDANNDELVQRVLRIAQGAALMTDTTTSHTVKTHCRGSLPNRTLMEHSYQAAQKVPAIVYSEEEVQFARSLYENCTGKTAPDEQEKLLPVQLHAPLPKEIVMGGSSDVGDVSYIAPTLQMIGPGCVAGGLPTHHWTVTAAAGTGIGEKAALYGAQVIAQSALEAFQNPDIVARCQEEFAQTIKTVGAYQKFQG